MSSIKARKTLSLGRLYRAGTGCTVSPDILLAVEATEKLRAFKKKTWDKKPKKVKKRYSQLGLEPWHPYS